MYLHEFSTPFANRKEWPEHVPRDLELRLIDALSYNSCTQADIWDEVKDWLEEHRVNCAVTVDGRETSPTVSSVVVR